MTELIRIPAPSLQRKQELMRDPSFVTFISSEERKYKYAYETPDGRWRIERDYGGCGGGWRVTDTHGEYVCTSCRRNSDGHATIAPTLAAAKAFVSEWAA